MRNLLNFLVRYSSWILFIFYVVMSCVLLFNNNPYQQHIYMTSANNIASSIYKTRSNVTSYFHLRDINDDLLKKNGELELEVIALKQKLRNIGDSIYVDTVAKIKPLSQFDFKVAHVINNSIARTHNFITIDKGANDGLKPEMGVLDQNGVIGIVNIVGENASRIISILNPDLRLSCKIKNTNDFGSLVWDGKNCQEAILEELPRHAIVNQGDTIITSGYSAVFPEGIPVGIAINRINEGSDDNCFALRVKLLTDFAKLNAVKIISNDQKDEIRRLEADGRQNK